MKNFFKNNNWRTSGHSQYTGWDVAWLAIKLLLALLRLVCKLIDFFNRKNDDNSGYRFSEK